MVSGAQPVVELADSGGVVSGETGQGIVHLGLPNKKSGLGDDSRGTGGFVVKGKEAEGGGCDGAGPDEATGTKGCGEGLGHLDIAASGTGDGVC